MATRKKQNEKLTNYNVTKKEIETERLRVRKSERERERFTT